jgi:hypothetical protein
VVHQDQHDCDHELGGQDPEGEGVAQLRGEAAGQEEDGAGEHDGGGDDEEDSKAVEFVVAEAVGEVGGVLEFGPVLVGEDDDCVGAGVPAMWRPTARIVITSKNRKALYRFRS